MYIVYSSLLQNTVPVGLIPKGNCLEYNIAFVPAELRPYINLTALDATVITGDLADANKFVWQVRDIMSAKRRGESAELFPSESMEDPAEKIQYQITALDKANARDLLKVVLTKTARKFYNKEFDNLNYSGVSKAEKDSWTVQREEAKKWELDNTAVTPVLSQLAELRGITRDQMAEKVLDKVSAYDQAIVDLLKRQQGIELKIKNAETLKELHMIANNYFGVSAYGYTFHFQEEVPPATFNL